MTRSRFALPVFVQIALLVAVSAALAMAICFGVILHAPPPPQPGFTIAEAVAALEGENIRTTEGRTLRRAVSATSPLAVDADQDPLARVISLTLQRHLDLGAEAVRVRVLGIDSDARHPGHDDIGGRWVGRAVDRAERRTETIIIRRGAPLPPPPPRPATPAVPVPPSPPGRMEIVTEDIQGPLDARLQQQITVSTDELRFPPFVASVRMEDGRWATVRPPTGLWSPWHTRVLLTFLASLALLLPLAWFMARRLARPIRLFARAAERLGSDPHAPPLEETGPAEVRDAAHAFNEMQAKLNRYVEGRTQMVAAIAHDLRTPLTRLRFRAEQADPAIRDRMAADIDEMNGMISQVLAYVRGVTLREVRVPLDLGTLIASVVDDLNEVGASASYVPGTDEIRVEGEGLNLRRAVGNLIENAVKFTGGADVSVTREPGLAVVTVTDTGPGLPPDELEAVFEPFQRGEKSRNRDTGGAGLGLAVARGVARAHGGDVTLTNRPEGGLIARLTLPLIMEN